MFGCGVSEKLDPRYVGPFKFTKGYGPVAYRLGLPPHLVIVHDASHVLQLKKYVSMLEQVGDTSNIHIEPDLIFEEQPVQVLDQKQWVVTREKTINLYRVQWSNQSRDEAT